MPKSRQMDKQRFRAKTENNSAHIAPVLDRFLAFVFDLIIFSPLFGLLLTPMWAPIEKLQAGASQNLELIVFCVGLIFYGLFLVIIFQTFAIFWFQTTPGKYFFKIKVASENGLPITFHQALLRSFFWCVELVFLGIPFFEVASDMKRRPIHDRVAGTLVLTLKGAIDKGPHPLERHFIRQVLLITTVALFSWVFLFLGHFYKLAESGDFKKTELEAEEYLCPEVSSLIGKKEHRIDKAIAFFIADEIQAECLHSEADFVLWRPDSSQNDWAYLAKAYLVKKNPEIFEAYLNRVCEENEEGDACKIAQYEANPNDQGLGKDLIDKYLTAKVLDSISSFEAGNYSTAEKKFAELSKVKGFDYFSKSGLVKSLWALNKQERSMGAYQAAIDGFSLDNQLELAAWTCHEQLDEACNATVKPACEDLKSILQKDNNSSDAFTSLALIRENECRGVANQDWRKFHALFEKKKDLFNFVRAIVNESKISPEQRNAILEDLAFRKTSVSPQFIRRMAVVALSERMQSRRQIEKVVEFLKLRKKKDLSWIKSYQRALHKLAELGQKKELSELLDLPGDELSLAYNLEEQKAQALILAKDFSSLEKRLGGGRSPASVSSGDDKISIEDLKEYFHKKREPQLKEGK